MTDYSETDTCWHLLCKTYGGKVSIVKNLDAPTARQAYQRLCPDTRPERHLRIPKGGYSWSSGWFSCDDGRIKQVDILGPEGCELDPWRGVPPIYYDCGDPRAKDFGPIRLSLEDGRKLEAQEQSERTGA